MSPSRRVAKCSGARSHGWPTRRPVRARYEETDMLRKTALTLALALLAAVAVPVLSIGDAEAQSKCTRVYTTSGWITRC